LGPLQKPKEASPIHKNKRDVLVSLRKIGEFVSKEGRGEDVNENHKEDEQEDEDDEEERMELEESKEERKRLRVPYAPKIKHDRLGIGLKSKLGIREPKVGDPNLGFVDGSRAARNLQRQIEGQLKKSGEGGGISRSSSSGGGVSSWMNGPRGTGRMTKRERDALAQKERRERQSMMAYFNS
jgi:hypothetical protein